MALKHELENENKKLKAYIEKLELELTKGKVYDLEKGDTVRFKKGNDIYRAKLNSNRNVSIVAEDTLYIKPIADNSVALFQTIK